MENSVFFGEKGLTSTSANHLANVAKECTTELLNKIENISLVNKTLQLIGGEESTVRLGWTDEEYSSLPEMLDKIARYNSLIAWLREAIKARTELTQALNRMKLEDYCQLKGIECVSPEYPHELTEEEYYDSLPIKERNRYYYLETIASTIGNAIHKSKAVNRARVELTQRIANPIDVDTNGRDTLIYHYSPSVKDSDGVFFALQAKHREVQAELNKMKHECQLAIDKSVNEANTQYLLEFDKYREQQKQLQAEFKEYRDKEGQRIAALKIVIPDSLKSVYEEVQSLGKED